MNTRWFKIYWVPWWDEEHRLYGCPIQVSVHTRKKFYLMRPFSNSQAYDWKRGHYSLETWKHIASGPENPEIWESLEKKRTKHAN